MQSIANKHDRLILGRFLSLVALLLYIGLHCVSAQAASRLVYSFEAPNSSSPLAGLLRGADGSFYGTSSGGGAAGKGTVFKFSPSGQLTVLHSFNGSDGDTPSTGLTLGLDGNFYGTTFLGGSNNYGTIFKITTNGNFVSLYSFPDGPAGVAPLGRLALAPDGSFYGTTSTGGPGAAGGIYRITPTGEFQFIYSFRNAPEVNARAGLLFASDGNFYGTTEGTIFKLTPAGEVTTIYALINYETEGAYIQASLVEGSDGSLYGTASNGGSHNVGTVFKLTKAGAFTLLHTFDNVTGAIPAAELLQGADGAFYGTTSSGGADGTESDPSYRGTVFKITSSGQFTTLHNFLGGEDGGVPRSSLVIGADGNFYGTTTGQDQYSSNGTIFKISSSGEFSSLLRFTQAKGGTPVGSLIPDSMGNLYGVASFGGTGSAGAIFKLSSTVQQTVLHSLSNTEGRLPREGLVRGSDGSFYGTTSEGGDYNHGSIFKVDTEGMLTKLHSFSEGEGSLPSAALVEAGDGAFYGVTSDGGAGFGTVFRVTATGTFTRLHTFNQTDGANPIGKLALGPDGSLYGVTVTGGSGLGTVFKLTTAGEFTSLYAFTTNEFGFSQNGAYPVAGLTLAYDGNFYGVTSQGTIFRISPQGTITTIHRITGAEGFGSEVPLTLGSDGDLYGSTHSGGAQYGPLLQTYGTLFKITTAGVFTRLHAFNGNDGSSPTAGLVQASNGKFYGSTPDGGAAGSGAIFELDAPPSSQLQ